MRPFDFVKPLTFDYERMVYGEIRARSRSKRVRCLADAYRRELAFLDRMGDANPVWNRLLTILVRGCWKAFARKGGPYVQRKP